MVGGSVSAFDALHDIRSSASLPVISSSRKPSAVFGTVPFEHPEIDKRPAIASFDPDSGRITFTDGTHVDDVDNVLFATGYDFSFPFIQEVKPRIQRIPSLYQHVFYNADPSLAFIGMMSSQDSISSRHFLKSF